MNPREDCIPIDKGVDDHGPIHELHPQGTTPGRSGSHDRCDSLIAEVGRNKKTWFVERSSRDFEQIGSGLLAHHPIHPRLVILSPGKKLKRDGVKVILVLQTGSKLFLWNPWLLTYHSAVPFSLFLCWCSLERSSHSFLVEVLQAGALQSYFFEDRHLANANHFIDSSILYQGSMSESLTALCQHQPPFGSYTILVKDEVYLSRILLLCALDN